MSDLKCCLMFLLIVFTAFTIQAQDRVVSTDDDLRDDFESFRTLEQKAKTLSRYGDAEKLLDTVKARPDSAEAYNRLALVYVQSGKSSEAIQALRRALEIKPDFVVAQLNLARLQQQLGDNLAARESFQRVIKLDPTMAEPHFELASCYAESERYDLATEQLLQAIRIKPDYFAAQNDLGVAYYRQGNFARAVDAFRKAASLRPDSAVVYGNLAMSNLKSDQNAAAIEALDRALELGAPDEPLLLYYKAYAYSKSGDDQMAMVNLEQALQIDPQFARARFNLGVLYYKHHQTNRSWETFLQLKKQDPELAQRLQNIFSRDRLLVVDQH
jgi:tetratricopeptide (TPR) repeat protein